jgi:hypothetical protein
MTLNAGIRTVLAIATLGLAGYFGVTAGTTGCPGTTTTGDTDGPQSPRSGPGCRGHRSGERRTHSAGRQRRAGRLGELRLEHRIESP